MTNTVTALSYVNTVNFWVCDKDKNVISYDYNQKVGSFQKLYFKLHYEIGRASCRERV